MTRLDTALVRLHVGQHRTVNLDELMEPLGQQLTVERGAGDQTFLLDNLHLTHHTYHVGKRSSPSRVQDPNVV